MTLIVEGKEVEFDLHGLANASMAKDDCTCFKVDSINELVQETYALECIAGQEKDTNTIDPAQEEAQ